jgi:TetR/AcrR family transcriptional repressor of mexJK operon
MKTITRERLLRASTELFLERGYDAASIDAIIARAGVARQTFYNHFESKQSLLDEVMQTCVSDRLLPLCEHAGDLRATLTTFATAYRSRTQSAQRIARYRLLAVEAQRSPQVSVEAYAQGLGQMLNSLADFLRCQMRAGKLRVADATFAAESLLSMLAGMEDTRHPQDEAQRLERCVDGFLDMFAVDPA